MNIFHPFVLGVFGIGIGLIAGYYLRRAFAQRQLDATERKVTQTVTEAKTQAKEIILSAKNQSVKILEESKRDEKTRRNQLVKAEERLQKKEDLLEKKLDNLDQSEAVLRTKVSEVKKIKSDIEELKKRHITDLERVANLDQNAAREELLSRVEKECGNDILARMKKLEEHGKETLEQRARDIMAWAIMRYAAPQISELTTTIISLPSDDMKGRIIGREGRNIKALERATGVEVIVDDTPEAIVISGFDPIRRHIAKMALERLISDGRIQPARIEETVEWAKEEINNKIREAGERAVYETGIIGLNPKLVYLIGRLHFRSSFGQNSLLHSMEVAFISEALAHGLGLDPLAAKKAGLLHDIGKAVDHEIEGGHPQIGYEILKKFALPDEVAYPSIGHHEDNPQTILSVIVKAADIISAARPGARRDTAENYIKRLEELENITKEFSGVEKSYAIQAGREIRIFVSPQEIDDLNAHRLARDIATRIEKELQYPGEIKVNVIREMRAIEYAR